MPRFERLSIFLIGPWLLLVLLLVVRNSTTPSIAEDFRAVYSSGFMLLSTGIGFGVAITFGTIAISDRNSSDTKSQCLKLLNVAAGLVMAVLSFWQLFIR